VEHSENHGNFLACSTDCMFPDL